MSNNKKISKWTPEWENKLISLVSGKKVEKTLKKDEIKPDGTKVTTDEEKITTSEVELLLGQIKYQKQLIKTKKTELDKKTGYADEAKQILKEIKELEPKVKEWDKFASWFESAYQKFLNGGTDGYGTGNVGWKVLLDNYSKSKYKKVANTSPSETNNSTATEDYGSNLYEFNTRTEIDNNQISYWKITESEVIKLITRTVKSLEDIDYDKFKNYTNAHAHPLSTNASEIDKSEYTAAKLQGYLKDIQDRAKCLVDNKIKTDGHPDKGKPANGHRVEYSFGQNFTKHGTNTPQDSGNFTQKELIGLFRLMRACQDSTWTNHADFKTATQNVKDDTLIVLPAKSSPMTKSDFTTFTPEDLGIPVDSNGKSNFYATDYGTKIDNDEDEDKIEYSWDTKKELKIEQGIQGWAKLINGITHTGIDDYTNRQKLISSFTDDPIRQLFTDIRSYVKKDNSLKSDKDSSGTTTPDYACFGSGATDRWTYHEFPDFYLKEESRLNEYELEKASLLESVKTGRESQKTLQKEYEEAKKELTSLKKEVDSKIQETITAKRQALKDKFKVSDTEANDFSGDSRITKTDHYKFRKLVEQIRFLVNFDEEKPTGQTNEDNAYAASQEITTKANELWHQSSWDSIGWKSEASEEENHNRPNSEKIKLIKANKDGEYDEGLNGWHDKLVELEKLVKLTDWEQKIKDDLKAAIDNQTPEETLADWQNSLKKYGLETVFTQDKLDKWKQKKDGQAKFDNLAAIETLLKKVCVFKDNEFEKVEVEFITFIKKKDSKLESLSQLIEQKDPVEVIKLITRWTDYEKLSDKDKKTKKQKLVWTLEKKGEDGKYLDDTDLTDEEITNTLYEIAIGKKTLASQKKVDSSDNNNQNEDETPNKSWLKFGKDNIGRPLFTYSTILLGIIGIAAFIFWEKITDWWNGPAEEEGTSELTKDEETNE